MIWMAYFDGLPKYPVFIFTDDAIADNDLELRLPVEQATINFPCGLSLWDINLVGR